jgi:hypothetical protein
MSYPFPPSFSHRCYEERNKNKEAFQVILSWAFISSDEKRNTEDYIELSELILYKAFGIRKLKLYI